MRWRSCPRHVGTAVSSPGRSSFRCAGRCARWLENTDSARRKRVVRSVHAGPVSGFAPPPDQESMPAKSGRTTMTRRTLLLLLPALAVYGLVRAGTSSWASATPAHAPCPRSGVALQGDSAARVRSLCREGVEDGSFRVALGRGGLDKRSEGDGRTPRGAYPLQPGRASRRYHLLLPVGYPTAAQVRNATRAARSACTARMRPSRGSGTPPPGRTGLSAASPSAPDRRSSASPDGWRRTLPGRS